MRTSLSVNCSAAQAKGFFFFFQKIAFVFSQIGHQYVSCHLLIMVTYCLKLTFFCSSFQPLFYLVLQRIFLFLKRDCFKYDGCELPQNSVHLWYNKPSVLSVFLFLHFIHQPINVNHFTGLSCTSSRNVMEMFYLREGCHYLLCLCIYMKCFEGEGIFSHSNALA